MHETEAAASVASFVHAAVLCLLRASVAGVVAALTTATTHHGVRSFCIIISWWHFDCVMLFSHAWCVHNTCTTPAKGGCVCGHVDVTQRKPCRRQHCNRCRGAQGFLFATRHPTIFPIHHRLAQQAQQLYITSLPVAVIREVMALQQRT
jgi:hypothetical protein